MINDKAFSNVFSNIKVNRGLIWGSLIISALIAFELFNYSTTDFAMRDLLGDLRFAGLRWSTILAFAFCVIDFAGIARLFTPEIGNQEPKEVWYLFSAWLLAATMNACLTWWGVSIALLNHATLGNQVVEQSVLLKVVPVFVAILVWLIRILIIGSFSTAGERLFSMAENNRLAEESPFVQPAGTRERVSNASKTSRPSTSVAYTPGLSRMNATSKSRPEPTYHPIQMAGTPNSNQQRRL